MRESFVAVLTARCWHGPLWHQLQHRKMLKKIFKKSQRCPGNISKHIRGQHHQSPVVSHLSPSPVTGLPSFIFNQSSVVHRQSSVITSQSSAVSRQSPVVSRQPSVVSLTSYSRLPQSSAAAPRRAAPTVRPTLSDSPQPSSPDAAWRATT